MENKNLKNGINELRKISMTSMEKKSILKNILEYSPKTNAPILSPWSFYSFLSLPKRQLAYYVIIPLIIILSSGGVVYASQESLPDDFLYPVKVKIIEPIGGVLSLSQKAKARHESKLASVRLVEAETLAKQGKLDDKKEAKINKLLESHIMALDKSINKINKSNSDKNTTKIITDFSYEMNSHAKKLDSILEDNNVELGQPDKNNKISEKARDNAEKIKNKLDDYKREIRDSEEKQPKSK